MRRRSARRYRPTPMRNQRRRARKKGLEKKRARTKGGSLLDGPVRDGVRPRPRRWAYGAFPTEKGRSRPFLGLQLLLLKDEEVLAVEHNIPFFLEEIEDPGHRFPGGAGH